MQTLFAFNLKNNQFEFYIPIDYEDFANYIIKGKEGVKNKNETGK